MLLYHTAFWWMDKSLTTFNKRFWSTKQNDLTVPLTTCVKFSKEKCESFYSPTEGMTATSVNTASIHACLFKKALSSATDPKDTLVGLSSAARLAFIYQRDCIHSWKSQESKVHVSTFQQLSPTGGVKCKQEKQGELPLKCQISAA